MRFAALGLILEDIEYICKTYKAMNADVNAVANLSGIFKEYSFKGI